MMKTWKKIACLILTLCMTALVYPQKTQRASADNPLAAKIRRFAPTILTANKPPLSPDDRKALMKIVAAAKLYDRLYPVRFGAATKPFGKSCKPTRLLWAVCAFTIS